MTDLPPFIADQLPLFSTIEGEPGGVHLSHELVVLLSEQLYQSPLKAIEELVVNSYDAEARSCRLYVPPPTKIGNLGSLVAIFDDGVGMDRQGLLDLWHIGHSRKRDPEMAARFKRKSIGKFGIGKLATYAVGKRLTHFSKTKDGEILGVSVDFSQFDRASGGETVKVSLPVNKVERWVDLLATPTFKAVVSGLGIDEAAFNGESWTLAIIEDLKPKAATLRMGQLKWVLSTAMPLATAFRLFLNNEEIHSSKEASKKLVEFSMADLPTRRLTNLLESTGVAWSIKDKAIVSDSFPSGVTAHVFVTEGSLYGKSDDVSRSLGFFVRVRGRLINLVDPYFGVSPKSYEVWNSFHADVTADDLDDLIMSSREGIESSSRKEQLQAVLSELFNEARVRFEDVKKKADDAAKKKREDERDFVAPRLVEEPMADALLQRRPGEDEWFYLAIDESSDTKKIVERLYNSPRVKYHFAYDHHGKNAPLFRYDPTNGTFSINEDHEFVKEHEEDPRARMLLEDVVTAEVMLEVYLRRAGVRPNVITDVFSNRDTLFRSLSRDRRFSLKAIASSLRDSVSDEHDLEVAVVYSSRALGFVANHISFAGEPDGIARFIDYPGGEKRIILEAKSSKDVPSLGAIDFAGLHSHMLSHGAQGCLLVAPAYPGSTRDEDSEASKRARALRISCWTAEQLALVVENAETRQITARKILDVVFNAFAPEDVTSRVQQMLVEPIWRHQDLYRAILEALRTLESTGADSPRDIGMVLAALGLHGSFKAISREEVRIAVSQIASASKGAITYRPDTESIIIHTSWDEIDRRLAALTGFPGAARKESPMRTNGDAPQ